MAKILPLTGKYYGTMIELESSEEHIINVWCPDHFAKPFASTREIERGWDPKDGHDHIEDVQSFRLAQIICKALTEEGF